MNFDFSDEQKMLREQAQRFLAARCPRNLVRQAMESEAGFDRGLWQAIAEQGWMGTAIPERHGGLGLGYLELCVIAQELGRAVAPIPFSSSVYLFAEALMLAGSEQQKARLLPELAAGRIVGTFACSEGPGPVTPRTIRAVLKAGALSGAKTAVADGMDAKFAIVLARTSDEAGEGGLTLALVPLEAPGITRHKQESLDPSRRHAQILFDEAPAEPLGAVGEGWALHARLLDRAAVLFAFEQLGGADAALDMAKDYALHRYAFGRPIGSYQAIKHKLAEMYVNNELARSNAYFAAWALAANAGDLPLAAAAARISATQAFDYAAKENLQTHGGIGFTWEMDCHLFYKRSRELGLVLGSQRSWKEKLVGQLERANAA